MNRRQLVKLASPLGELLNDANHVDVKSISSDLSMRVFIAGMMSYCPAWLKFLYMVRWALVRALGMKQEGVPMGRALTADDVSLRAGEMVTFFRVHGAEDEKYWIAAASDKHLAAFVAVVADRQTHPKQFHLATIVKYRHWTGPVYFNLIRPFHHLVVRRMMRAGARL
jgi:hypothetical protein